MVGWLTQGKMGMHISAVIPSSSLAARRDVATGRIVNAYHGAPGKGSAKSYSGHCELQTVAGREELLAYESDINQIYFRRHRFCCCCGYRIVEVRDGGGGVNPEGGICESFGFESLILRL